METIKIEILNPRAKRLLQDLAALNLIRFKDSEDSKTEFKNLLIRLRSSKVPPISLKQITKEVEAVRQKRYGN
jgi:transcription initiation factor IIE alpha subunit